MRSVADFRLANLVTGFTPGRLFQISTRRLLSGPIRSANCSSLAKARGLIVGQLVTEAANDKEQVEPMVAAIEQQSGQRPQAILADTGYCSEENLAHLESSEQPERKIEGYIATHKQKHDERRAPCKRGPLPKGATRVERMRRKLQTKAGKAIYAARKCVVEPVFGQIKQARGFRQFLLRGKAKVQGEWALVCLTHNILRLFATQ